MPRIEGRYPCIEHEYECSDSAPIKGGEGDFLGKGICTGVYIDMWPHVDQELYINVKPHGTVGTGFKTINIPHPFPGMRIPFNQLMDVEVRTSFHLALLSTWRVRLYLLDEFTLPEGFYINTPQEACWFPLVRDGTFRFGQADEAGDGFICPRTGVIGVQYLSDNAFARTLYVQGYCGAQPYPILNVAQIPASASGEVWAKSIQMAANMEFMYGGPLTKGKFYRMFWTNNDDDTNEVVSIDLGFMPTPMTWS